MLSVYITDRPNQSIQFIKANTDWGRKLFTTFIDGGETIKLITTPEGLRGLRGIIAYFDYTFYELSSSRERDAWYGMLASVGAEAIEIYERQHEQNNNYT